MIPLILQVAALQTEYPNGKCKIKRHTRLIWSGRIRPTPLSLEYFVLIIYKIGRAPRIWVIGDELEKLDDPEFPHKYEIDNENKKVRLCLYRYQEFNQYKYLSKTIIPWTIEWLYFYEIWLVTGEWCGGGEHPRPGEEKDDNVA